MALKNHLQPFRPLCGGIVIATATVNHYGTLGVITTSNGNDVWGITCAHVLGPPGGPVPDLDAVFQPDTSKEQFRIGATSTDRSNQALDCAAFLITNGLATVNEILGLGVISKPRKPSVGDRVVKSGRSTGITEGQIASIIGAEIRIEKVSHFPAAYNLSEPGDSGAIWCDIATKAPVALHKRGSDAGASVSFASDLTAVLQVLRLQSF